MRFANKGVIVTGGGSGIGHVTALRFAAEGAAVLVADLDHDAARQAAAEITAAGGVAHGFRLDVVDECATRTLIAEAKDALGSLDVIFCNAGISGVTPAAELAVDAWRRVIDVNVNGVFISAQAFAQHCIREGKGGAIVSTASTFGVMATTSRCAYVTSKHAVVGMTKALAMDLAPHDIRVNAVGPGLIRTPLTERYFHDPEMVARIKAVHPMGRWGEMSEVANAVLYLASDDASFCTGTHLVVDGGWTAGKKM